MSDDPHRSTEPKPGELNLSNLAGAGLQFAVSIVVFLLLGQWADRKLGTSPILLLVGVFIGGSAAFYSMYRRITAAQRADDDSRRRDREAGSKK
jgi:F0F1-type ATP synthase assembly protein I